MPLVPIDLSLGLAPAVSDLSVVPSVVRNFEVDGLGANTPRPGSVALTLTSFTTDPVIGAVVFMDYLVLVTEDTFGTRTFWAVSPASPTVASVLSGTTLSGTRPPVFALGAQYVYVTGGGQVMRWRPGMPAFETMSNSPTCTHVVALGQRLVANTTEAPSNIRWSDLGEGVWTAWSAGDTQDADARPDPVISVYENSRRLFIFGAESTQVHEVSADPTLPFGFIDSLAFGIGAPYAVVQDDAGLFVLDSRSRIVRTNGSEATVISDDLASTLRGFSSIEDCFGYREEVNQHTNLVWCFPSQGVSYVFDLNRARWTERTLYRQGTQQNWPATASVYWPRLRYHIIGASLPEMNLLRMSTDATTDAGGGPILCERVTGWNDYGSPEYKRSLRVRCVVKRGTGAENSTTGFIECRVQHERGDWSAWKSKSIGTPSQRDHVVDFHFGGVFRSRRLHFRYGASERTALVAAYDDVEVLAPGADE